jgi:hypothetical protein
LARFRTCADRLVGSFGAVSPVENGRAVGFVRRVLSAAGACDVVPKNRWLASFRKNFRRPIPLARHEF